MYFLLHEIYNCVHVDLTFLAPKMVDKQEKVLKAKCTLSFFSDVDAEFSDWLPK